MANRTNKSAKKGENPQSDGSNKGSKRGRWGRGHFAKDQFTQSNQCHFRFDQNYNGPPTPNNNNNSNSLAYYAFLDVVANSEGLMDSGPTNQVTRDYTSILQQE